MKGQSLHSNGCSRLLSPLVRRSVGDRRGYTTSVRTGSQNQPTPRAPMIHRQMRLHLRDTLLLLDSNYYT